MVFWLKITTTKDKGSRGVARLDEEPGNLGNRVVTGGRGDVSEGEVIADEKA